MTVVVVLHYINLAVRTCDELIALRGGRILAQGAAADLVTPTCWARSMACPWGSSPIPCGANPWAMCCDRPLPPRASGGPWPCRRLAGKGCLAPAGRDAGLALLETLLALGVVPVAAAELVLYRRQVIEPAVPESVADLGLRGSPSFEALKLLAPDLILGSNYTAGLNRRSAALRRWRASPSMGPGGHPYAAAEAAHPRHRRPPRHRASGRGADTRERCCSRRAESPAERRRRAPRTGHQSG